MQGRGSKGGVSTAMPNDLKIPKPPKQPDKPLPAYMRYSRKVWESVKSQHPDMKMWDIGKLIGEQWRNLPENERQAFFAEYEVEKSEYQEAMKEYHNSTAYREWLKAKERAMNAMQEQQMMEKSMGGSIPKEEPRFQLQQIEDEDDEGDFSIKHVAAARFQRNHRLIAEIFSEAAVPDIKTVVTKPRLENLKRQVQSLMQHQRKLEGEIEEMESKFSAKKQKVLDEAKKFADSMEEIASRPIPEIKKEEKSRKKCENENGSKEKKEVDSVVVATDSANVNNSTAPALIENNEAAKIKSQQDNESLQNTLPRTKTEADQYQQPHQPELM